MTIYLSNNLFVFFTGMLLLIGSATDLLAQDRQAVEDKELINARSTYIDGLAAFENENYQQALDLLSAAYVKLPDHPGVNFALADAYFMMNDLANAEYYGKQAIKLDPQNLWYHLKLANIYQESGKSEAALKELNAALNYHPNNTNLLYELAQTYREMDKLLEANKIYNKLLYLRGEDISLRLKRLQIFNSLDMRDSAITELQKIRKHDPSNLSTLHILSNHYLEMGRLDEAKEVLENALEINSRNSKTLIMLSDIYIKRAKWDRVNTLLGNAVTDTSVSVQEKINIARQLLSKFNEDRNNTKLRETIGSLLQKIMHAEPQSGPIQALAADFFAKTEQNELALQALERTTKLTPTNDSAWRQRLQILLMEGKTDEAITVGEQAVKEIPQAPILLYFLGSAHLSNQHPERAITYFKKAIELPIRQSMKRNILNSLGDAHAALRNWEQAFANYEASLKIDPQNGAVLNNYAYYLAIQNEQLQKAEEMAKKALELDSENPSYLDTAGWIYYQKGAYDKAEKYIRKSLNTGKASAEVMEHLGDVLDKLDKTDKAKKWWQKAFEKDSTRTHLKEKISTESE